MIDVPRRKLSELAFIYNHNPDLRDVYVEGPFDESVIRWFVQECDVPEVAVYPINAIEIPDANLIEAGRQTNNRERVAFLAEFLRTSRVQRAVCIIDADFEHFRNSEPPEPPLYQTDYACMEMYFFCEPSFAKFLTLGCQRGDWPVDEIMAAIASVVQEFFLYRCANDDLGWGMAWLDKNACVRIDGWEIILDADAFLLRLLNKNSKAGDKEVFEECVDNLRPSLKEDPRYQLHGHDLTSLLSWYLRKKGVSGPRVQVDSIVAAMTISLDHHRLKEEPMFQAILARLA